MREDDGWGGRERDGEVTREGDDGRGEDEDGTEREWGMGEGRGRE